MIMIQFCYDSSYHRVLSSTKAGISWYCGDDIIFRYHTSGVKCMCVKRYLQMLQDMLPFLRLSDCLVLRVLTPVMYCVYRYHIDERFFCDYT